MLSSICLALFASPPPLVQNPTAELRAEAHAAFALWVNDDLPAAMRAGATAVRGAAERLAALPDPDAPDARALADELEFTLIQLTRWSEAADNRGVLRELLDGVQIDPRHGAAFSTHAWVRADARDALGVLVNWEFIGPFDNERGGGMKRQTPPEESPDSGLTHDGKVREVSWRSFPATPPARGIINLGALLDPFDQVCALARSWIESPEEQAVYLMVGADEEVRVWLNGVTVFDAFGIHDLHEDAFCVPLELNAGWNELTVKVGGRDGMPRFVARLADVERGSPLHLRQVAELPDGLTPLELSRMRAPMAQRGLSAVRPGIWSRVVADEDGEASAETDWRRSVLEYFYRPTEEKEHPGREAATRAAEKSPEELRYLVQHTLTLHERSAASAEQDANPWLHSIDRILAHSPELPVALRWRANHAWFGQRTPDRALEYVDRALATRPDSIPALTLRARILSGSNQDSLGRRVWKRILRHDDLRYFPGTALSALRVLPANDPERVPIYDVVIAANAHPDAIQERAKRLRFETGDRSAEVALALLDELLADQPWSIGAHLGVAELLLATDHPREAQSVLALATELAPDHAPLFMWRARACLQLGDVEGAAVALERELELDFSAADERRLLEILRAQGAEPFHTPFRESLAAILERQAAAPPLGAGDVSREVILERAVIEVQPDATAKRYFHRVQRVLNETGVRALDRIPLRAWAGEQEVRVLVADVHRVDGTVLHAPTGRGGRGGGIWVDLPPLEIGDVINLEYRLDDLRPTFFGRYFGMNQQLAPFASLPVYESELVLLATDDLPLVFHTRNYDGTVESRPLEDGRTEHRWRLEGWTPMRTELYMPPANEVTPAIQASSYASWEEFGTWWWNLIEDEIRVSPEMAEKVAELTANAATGEEKIRALYDFVVTDIRYNAWEFGVHGYEPYSAAVIFSRGFGDCKDKAILLRALLSEVGIEAYPVLIRLEGRRSEEDHTLALVEHFNHCIAYVPAQEGTEERFLDGTARHHPFDIVPTADNGARVVIVKPDGVEQRRIPFAPAEENRVEHDFKVELKSGGEARVQYVQRTSGRYDPSLRGRFSGSEEERAEEADRAMSSIFGAISGEVETEFTDFEDLGTPAEARFSCAPERVARPTEGGYELPRAFNEFHLLRGMARETDRTTDLLLDTPWRSEVTIEYVLPPGHRIPEPPPPVHLDGEDASYSWEAELTDNGVLIRERFEIKTPRITPERYESFRELCRVVDTTQDNTVTVEVKP